MKGSKFVVVAIAALVALAAFNSVSKTKDHRVSLEVASAHGLWASSFGKVYSSPEEQSFRLRIFSENAAMINEHNSNPEKTYTQGLNQFSDMTDEELRAKFGLGAMTPEDIQALNSLPVAHDSEANLTQGSVDWRQKNVLPGILNQGSCGSCWAFAAASAAESNYNRVNGVREQFSPQAILDCSGGGNCAQGGYPFKGLQYLTSNGAVPLTSYPYVGVQQGCKGLQNVRRMSFNP